MVHIDDPQTQKANLRYFKSVMRAPMLERETEFDLARRWRDDADEAALHQLVQAYARLVVSAATKFRNYGLPIGDLVQEGNIGLMKAVDKFDLAQGLQVLHLRHMVDTVRYAGLYSAQLVYRPHWYDGGAEIAFL